MVASGRRGRGRVLRIKRHEQDAVAALVEQRLEARADGRMAVAHGPVDADLVARHDLEMVRELLRLPAGDGLERPLVSGLVPDGVVVAPFALRPRRQDDQVEHRPPRQTRRFDDTAVGQEFLEVAPHRPVAGPLRRAEIEEQHADAAPLERRMVDRFLRGRKGIGARHDVHQRNLDGVWRNSSVA